MGGAGSKGKIEHRNYVAGNPTVLLKAKEDLLR